MHPVAAGCIFYGNNRMPPVTCCCRKVAEHDGQCEHWPFWRNGTETWRSVWIGPLLFLIAGRRELPRLEVLQAAGERCVWRKCIMAKNESLHVAVWSVYVEQNMFLRDLGKKYIVQTERKRNGDGTETWQSHAKEDTQNWQEKLTNLMGKLRCAREHSVQFFVQLYFTQLNCTV